MSRTILVIDDEEIILKTIEKYLKINGYNVDTATNGARAIEMVKTFQYDLIISDVRMPEMGGVETLRRIRTHLEKENRSKIPAVVITGYSDEDVTCQAADISAVDFLYKPFELDEFIKTVRKNIESAPVYKRAHQRVSVDFPAKVKSEEASLNSLEKRPARLLNLSEGGLCLDSKEEFSEKSALDITINASPFSRILSLRGKIVWYQFTDGTSGFRYGVCFEGLKEDSVPILRDILFKYKFLDERFISLTKDMETFVKNLKYELDEFDRLNDFDAAKQAQFIEWNKKSIYEEFDSRFQKIWDMVKDFSQDRYLSHQNYFQTILLPFLSEQIEINKYIYDKPLGYAGDYVMMNYIFDYHKNNYLGESLFQKLVNNYTCNTPISCSNVERKNYLKEKILKVLAKDKTAKIVSLGSGPGREWIELLNEGKINKSVNFKCLDLEGGALDFVRNEIENVSLNKKQFLAVDYLQKDIISIVRDKNLQEEFKDADLIYVSGVYDYLREKMASSLTESLFNLLAKGGELIIINASLEKSSHRAYYELLGGWNLVYRTEKEMLGWLREVQNYAQADFEKPSLDNNYLFLNIKKA